MAKKSVARNQESIDPLFFIPDGVDELTHEEPETLARPLREPSDDGFSDDGMGFFDDDFMDYSGVGYFDVDVDSSYEEGALATPTVVNVVSQTVRQTSSGMELVDVVIEVEGIGGQQYEMRVTKV